MINWPKCPGCQARRITRCPICGTAGTDFPAADMDISVLLGLDRPAAGGGGCSCGSGGCGPRVVESEGQAGEEGSSESEAPAAMLLCPMCDEPFVPTYPRRCEWCDHMFDEGWDNEIHPAPADPINGRTVVVSLLVAAVLVGMVAYLMWVL